MATIKGELNLPNGSGGYDKHHLETEVAQVVGLAEQYRQPNETVTAGTIRYHQSLPVGWYLECTTAGTTSSGALTISSPEVGGTVSDGTVVWTVRSNFSYVTVTNDCDDTLLTGLSVAPPTALNIPPEYSYYGIQTYSIAGATHQIAVAIEYGHTFTRTKNNNVWTAWQQQEAIVAKSLGTNGYIKYASGLILQWGTRILNMSSISGVYVDVVGLPIRMTTLNYKVMVTPVSTNGQAFVGVQSIYSDAFNFVCATDQSGKEYQWIAIGY